MAYRVIQWSTGNVGRYALRSIIKHPDLELAGVVVHSEAKEGKDAAELCGMKEPTGVKATRDVDALLDAGADCVSYTAAAEIRMPDAAADMVKCLERGINVVSSSLVMLVDGPLSPLSFLTDQLQAACEKGKSTFITSGIDPGFATDMMPLIFSGLSEHWTQVRMQEIVNYSTYNQPETVLGIMGFGGDLNDKPLLLQPGTLEMAWGGTVRLVAKGLGVTLDGIDAIIERRPAEHDIDTPLGVIKKGTAAGLRFEVRGLVDGHPAVVLEHVTRMHDDIAPDWPKGRGYAAIVEGVPRMHVVLNMEDEHGDHAVGGVVLTGTRLVNMIPAVVAHPPGVISALELPTVTGRGLYAAPGVDRGY